MFIAFVTFIFFGYESTSSLIPQETSSRLIRVGIINAFGFLVEIYDPFLTN